MSFNFFLFLILVIGLLFYTVTYPYQSKLVRKLNRVKNFPEIDSIRNLDSSYTGISKREIEESVYIEEKKIKSSYVKEEMGYTLVIPKKNLTEDTPCLILLHGLRDSSRDWLERAMLLENYVHLLKSGEIEPMIFLLPESGDEGQSWYSNYAGESFHNYEDYIMGELIPEINMRFKNVKMGIGGFSMGGYAAFKLGIRYLDKFTVVGSFSGAVSLIRMSVNRRVIRLMRLLYIPKFIFSDIDKLQFLKVFGSWGYKILKEDPYTMIKYKADESLRDRYFYASVGTEDRVNHLMLQQWIDIMGRMKRKNCKFKGYLCENENHTWEYVARDLGNFLKYFNERIR